VMTSTTAAPRGKTYRYYACTEVNRRGREQCPVKAVPAAEIEKFIVERIQELGTDPAMLRESLEAAAADREKEKPRLEQEERRLQIELQNCKLESRRLIGALASVQGNEVKSITERLGEIDARAADIERRLTETQDALAHLARTSVDPEQAAQAMAQFIPLWEALTTTERARLVDLLIQRIDYDGVSDEVAITFRPNGLATFTQEATAAGAAASTHPARSSATRSTRAATASAPRCSSRRVPRPRRSRRRVFLASHGWSRSPTNPSGCSTPGRSPRWPSWLA